MKFVTVYRKVAGSYHHPDTSALGMIIRNHISGITFSSPSPLEVMAASFNLPAGKPFYEELRACSKAELCTGDCWIELREAGNSEDKSKLEKIIIPNVLQFYGVQEESIRLFLRLSEAKLVSAFVGTTGGYLPHESTWSGICDSLESSLIGLGFSPADMIYLNFEKDYALPK